MALARRFFCVLVVLALALGTVTTAARAGGMAGTMNHDGTAAAMDAGMMHSMPDTPEFCPECGAGGTMAACAQSICRLALGILPLQSLAISGALQTFDAAGAEAASGLKPLPDPPPPRTTVTG